MATSLVRWGILGTAGIARKNWRAIRLSGNGTLAAVASRDAARAREFVAACQAEVPFPAAPRALGSYAELLASPDIDAVYVPLPTGVRMEWVIRAAEAGKHIVCEKPCAVSAADLREMLAACARHSVNFMDGVMFRHGARLTRLGAALGDTDNFGALRRVTCGFSFAAPPEFFANNIRGQAALEPHGCLGDLGWYCAQLALWAAGWRLPREVTARMPDAHGGVPAELTAELTFDGGLTAGFYCAFTTANQQWAHFAGTRGAARVDDFVLPFAGAETAFETQRAELLINGCDFRMEPHARRITVAEHGHGHATAQEANLFRHFAARVLAGTRDEPWPTVALQTQQVVDACLASARTDGRAVAPV